MAEKPSYTVGLSRREFIKVSAVALATARLPRRLLTVLGTEHREAGNWAGLTLGASGIGPNWPTGLWEVYDRLGIRNQPNFMYRRWDNFSRNFASDAWNTETISAMPEDTLTPHVFLMVSETDQEAALPLVHQHGERENGESVDRLFLGLKETADDTGSGVLVPPTIKDKKLKYIELGQKKDEKGRAIIGPMQKIIGRGTVVQQPMFTVEGDEVTFTPPFFRDFGLEEAKALTNIPDTGGRRFFISYADVKFPPKVSDEHDMKIHYEDARKEQEYMGIKYNGSTIVDKSIAGKIDKITYNHQAYAKYLALVIFKIWWAKGNVEHKKLPTENDFAAFMQSWAKAQATNNPEDWEQVQFKIHANNLDDNDGYVQEETVIWPMCDQEKIRVPDGVFAMKSFSNVLVDGDSKNIKNVTEWLWSINPGVRLGGMGVNLDNNGSFYIYVWPYTGRISEHNVIKASFASIVWWVKHNRGGKKVSAPLDAADEELYNLLKWGMVITNR